jgi:hypothetical protein
MKNVMALGAGGALVAGAVAIATASPSWAMPVLSKTAAVVTAASNAVTDVRYHRRGYYRHGCYRRGYYGRGYGYPWWYNPYSYYYPYYYTYPFTFGFRWGGWGW